MNILFQTRRPRHFHHEMIYVDERKERLELLEERALLEIKSGASPSKDVLRERLHSAMRPSARRLKSQHSFYIIVPVLLILLFSVLLILIL